MQELIVVTTKLVHICGWEISQWHEEHVSQIILCNIAYSRVILNTSKLPFHLTWWIINAPVSSHSVRGNHGRHRDKQAPIKNVQVRFPRGNLRLYATAVPPQYLHVNIHMSIPPLRDTAANYHEPPVSSIRNAPRLLHPRRCWETLPLLCQPRKFAKTRPNHAMLRDFKYFACVILALGRHPFVFDTNKGRFGGFLGPGICNFRKLFTCVRFFWSLHVRLGKHEWTDKFFFGY